MPKIYACFTRHRNLVDTYQHTVKYDHKRTGNIPSPRLKTYVNNYNFGRTHIYIYYLVL